MFIIDQKIGLIILNLEKLFFFYETEKRKKIIGKAIITEVKINKKNKLIREFEILGCWNQKEIESEIKNTDEAMAFKFSFFQPCVSNITLNDLKIIINNNITTVAPIKVNREHHKKILKKGF